MLPYEHQGGGKTYQTGDFKDYLPQAAGGSGKGTGEGSLGHILYVRDSAASTIQMKILMMIWIFRLLPCPLLYCDWLYLRAILEHAVPTPLCKVSNDAHVPERHSTFRLHASTCRFAVFNTLDISAYICSEILQRSALHCSALHWQYDATMANCFDCNCLISYHTAHQPEKTALPNKLLLLQF